LIYQTDMNKEKIKHSIILSIKILPLILVGLWVLTLVWIGVLKNKPVNHTPQMLAYDFSKIGDSLKYKVEHEWIPLDSISENLVMAVLAAEDRNFFVHEGFALKSDSDSLVEKHDFLEQKTISQQTANAVFLMNGKTWFHRINETYYTVMIEEFWGKRRILEVYLNSELMGDGIFGAEAASQIYFRKKAGELTRDEASFIAAAIESPLGVNVQHLSDSLISRKKKILEDMSLMMKVKIGKKPIDEVENLKFKPVYRRKWRG
jgi:monofunctional glycosyltransferase